MRVWVRKWWWWLAPMIRMRICINNIWACNNKTMIFSKNIMTKVSKLLLKVLKWMKSRKIVRLKLLIELVRQTRMKKWMIKMMIRIMMIRLPVLFKTIHRSLNNKNKITNSKRLNPKGAHKNKNNPKKVSNQFKSRNSPNKIKAHQLFGIWLMSS